MANILLCFHAEAEYTGYDGEALLVFYDSLVQALGAQGNNILIFNSDFFPWEKLESNTLKRGADSSKITAAVKAFAPDLIISYNHTLPPNIEAHLFCPILLWAGDGFWYWKDAKEALPKNHPLVVNSEGMLREFSQLGFTNIHQLSLATSVRSQAKEKLYNISFIGSLFFHTPCTKMIAQSPELRPKIQDMIRSFCLHNEYNPNALLHSSHGEDILPLVAPDEIFNGFIDLRLTVVAALLEEGIEIFGSGYWASFAAHFWPFLAASFNPQKVYSLRHNEDIYNSSKLALNINHPQAKLDSFSWRVYDILASDACILAQKNTGLQKLLKPYIDLPMFESPSQAHSLAKKLLEAPSWRQEIIEASQAFIEKEGRWDKNIRLLEEITGVSLCGEGRGSLSFLKSEDCFNTLGRAVNGVISLLPAPKPKGRSLSDILAVKALRWGKSLTGLNPGNEFNLRKYSL